MHTFTLSVPCPATGAIHDFGQIIELARERASALDAVVYIHRENAEPGCPNLWAVSPKGYLSVEGVAMPDCKGCGEA
jgi:hypothetical protein